MKDAFNKCPASKRKWWADKWDGLKRPHKIFLVAVVAIVVINIFN